MAPEVEAELGDDDQDDGINASCLEKEPHPNPFPPAEKAIGTTPTPVSPRAKNSPGRCPIISDELETFVGREGWKGFPTVDYDFR